MDGLASSFVQHVLPRFLLFSDLLQACVVCQSWREGCQLEVARRLKEAGEELEDIRLRVGTWGAYHTAQPRALLLLLHCSLREAVTRPKPTACGGPLMEWDEDVIWVWQQEYSVAPGGTVWLGSGLSHDGQAWRQEIEYVASRETTPGDDACVVHLRFSVPCAAAGHPLAALQQHRAISRQLLMYSAHQHGLFEARGPTLGDSLHLPFGLEWRWRLGIKECTVAGAFTLTWLGCPQTALRGYFAPAEGDHPTPVHIHVGCQDARDGTGGLAPMFASPAAFRAVALAQLDGLEARITQTLESNPLLMRSCFKEIQVPDMRCGGFTSHCTNEVVFTAADPRGILRGHHARAQNLRTYISGHADLLFSALRPLVPWPVLACLGTGPVPSPSPP